MYVPVGWGTVVTSEQVLRERPQIRHADTPVYDDLRTSAPLRGELIGRSSRGITAIHHLAFATDGDRAQSVMEDPDHDVLVVNLSGTGHAYRRDDRRWTARPLVAGDTSFLPRGWRNELDLPAMHSAVIIGLPRSVIDTALLEAGGQLPSAIWGQAQDRLATPLKQLVHELRAPAMPGELVLDCLIDSVVHLLCNPPGRMEAERLHMSPARLARVKTHIDAKLAEEISLAELAAVAGLSVFHFARVFKQATGKSPHSFVNDRRLARACMLLRTPSLPLAGIAKACGFASQAHFTAAFRRAMAVTPGRYRSIILD